VIAYGTRFPAVVRLPATSSYFNLVYFRHQQQEVKAKEQICSTLVLCGLSQFLLDSGLLIRHWDSAILNQVLNGRFN